MELCCSLFGAYCPRKMFMMKTSSRKLDVAVVVQVAVGEVIVTVVAGIVVVLTAAVVEDLKPESSEW